MSKKKQKPKPKKKRSSLKNNVIVKPRNYLVVNSVKATHTHAASIAKKIKKRPCLILLSGALGVGKSEWVRGFVKAYLKSKIIVTSPTYSIVNLYGTKSKPVYHVDLYRLKSEDDLESVGFWDLLQGKNIILVEWGDMLPPRWPKEIAVLSIKIDLLSEPERRISLLFEQD
ncbi:MAG: tRNA (adenosine(37)-N6)-threonylcarbamoyltransferase complex ATPase subunit type 1 TsaE [Oligoflexia bacterium]|nr:tRNA (adenosine(37)-N6)-threonylcarbamoyltransferase complex ATPase subunit type 1 TsaE [Oligoflexia bacterium]